MAKMLEKFLDAGQRLSERVGLEPAFEHGAGCKRRGVLKIRHENFSEEHNVSRLIKRPSIGLGVRSFDVIPIVVPVKIKIIRTCDSCGVTDDYLENKVTSAPHSITGW